MGDSNKQICRLCLDITPDSECEAIEEIKKKTLKDLLINIDLEISDYAVACLKCAQSLQECFDFKSYFVNTLMDIEIKADVKNVFSMSNEDTRLVNPNCVNTPMDTAVDTDMNKAFHMIKTSQTCQLCTSFIEDSTFCKGGVFLTDIIRHCLPEMDLNAIHELLICKSCLNCFERYEKFIKSCQAVEKRIAHYRLVAGHDAASKVILKDVLKYGDYNMLDGQIVIKNECSDVDMDTINYPKREEIVHVKCEGINLKTALDNGHQISESDQLEDCNSFETNFPSTRNRDSTDIDAIKGASFNLGDKFYTYEEVQQAIDNYARNNYTALWKRDARTISGSKVKRFIDEKLIYYELKYSCIHGGRNFVSCSKGLRDVWTYRKECPFFIRLRASKDGKSLDVIATNSNHNHDISEQHYAHIFQKDFERQLPDDCKIMEQELLALKANKKLVKDKVTEETGNVVLLKDLSNLRSANDTQKNNLVNSIKLIQEKYDCEITVLENENFQALLAQTPYMKKIFNLYPEFLAVDATYKLLNIGIPLYLLLVEDGHCQSQIVAMCLMVSETKDNIRWFLSTFKNLNPIAKETKCVIVDKDLTEREVIRELFPEVSLIPCIFHTMRTFRRELKCDKMGITDNQKTCCLEYLKNLIYAKTEEEFSRILITFEEVAPKTVLNYYFKNWHDIKHQWSFMCTEFCKYNFLNSTNNRLETISGKVKDVISKNSSLDDFFNAFFKTIASMNSELEHKVIYNQLKRPVTQFGAGSVQAKYLELLTREPARQVIKQIENSSKVANIEPDPENRNLFQIKSSEGVIQTDIYKCTCSYYVSMLLPCRHIFAVRKLLNEPLYDPLLPNKRWSANYNKSTNTFTSNHHDADNTENQPTVTTTKSRNIVSYGQKRKDVLSITNNLADLAAQKSNTSFERRKQLLLILKKYWESDVDVRIMPVTEDEETTVGIINKDPHVTVDKETIVEVPNVIMEDYVDNLLIINCEAGTDFAQVKPSDPGSNIPHQDIQSIKMPQKVEKRGRTKGANLTAVGLPEKRKRNGPTPFIQLSVQEKQIFILKLILVDQEEPLSIDDSNTKFTKNDIIMPELLPSIFVDKTINIHLIKQFLSKEAFTFLNHAIEAKRNNGVIICSCCDKDVTTDDFIFCHGCLERSHLECLGITIKLKNYFCNICRLK